MLFHAFCGALLTLAGQAASANPVPQVPLTGQNSGSLSLANDESPFTLNYASSPANENNWIGLYRRGGGPQDGKSRGQSLVWDWASEAEGTVFLDASELTPGEYEAWLLADGGYVALSEPLELELSRLPGPITFILDELTLKNGRVGDEFEAKVTGFLRGGGDTEISWNVNSTCIFFAEYEESEEECDGDEWLSISSDGVLSGTPSSAGVSEFVVTVSTDDHRAVDLRISIPVVTSDSPLVSELSVLTYNLWYGGTKVNGYHWKQLEFLATGGFDIVALQETTSDHAIRLARALGWDYFQSTKSVGIISRYPIAETYPEHGHGGAVRVALDGDKSQINIWSVHLNAYPYGPYGFCFDNLSADSVMETENGEARRGPQIRETLDLMADHLDNADDIPVILAGDFNAPSHLDYTEATSRRHCGAGSFKWPTSTAPIDAGLTDSYREAHPDPVTKRGITWSPIYLDNEGRKEPLDRIDFLYYKGGLDVRSSKTLVVGHPEPEPNHENNEWTSDHAAVVAKYRLK